MKVKIKLSCTGFFVEYEGMQRPSRRALQANKRFFAGYEGQYLAIMYTRMGFVVEYDGSKDQAITHTSMGNFAVYES